MFNPFSQKGKTILVTGASSGIGRGLINKGMKVMVSGFGVGLSWGGTLLHLK